MIQELSYGIVPLKKENNDWYTLLIMHTKGGYWAFPKGHAESGEVPLEAAQRELFEETGLKVEKLLSDNPLKETYSFYRGPKHIQKTVTYFLGEVTGDVVLQKSEVYTSCWVKLKDAENQVTYKECKSICRQALQLLQREL